ncbi:MAG: translocation/assembly module TamB domain-containing protein [Methylocystis sp.]
MRGRIWRYIGGGIGLVLLVFALAAIGLNAKTQSGKSVLADFVSRAASSENMKLDIGAIEGPLSAHPMLRDISLADKNGVWLKIDQVEMDWSRLPLASLRVDIDRVVIGRVDVLRRPVSAPAAAAKPTAPAKKTSADAAPDLPVRFRLGAFQVDTLALAAPVLGEPATLTLTGSADAGASSNGAKATLSARRTDAPGAVNLTMAISPSPNRVSLALSAQEPAGGIIARLAQLPDLPPIDVSLNGEGPLDNFVAKLVARAGEQLGAQGDATITRVAVGRRVEFDFASRFAPLLPKALADLFADGAKLRGAAVLANDGSMTLDNLALENSALRLGASGRLGADQKIEAHVTLHGLPTSETAPFRAKTLEGELTVTGSAAQPDAKLRLLVEDALSSAGRIGHFNADVTAVADGPPADTAAHFDIAIDARGDELALADRGLADALGDHMTLNLRARANGAGDADIGLAKIETTSAAVTFAGKAGPTALDGEAKITASDLSRFAHLAKRDLRGALTLSAALSGAPSNGSIKAVLSGAVNAPSVGLAAIDGLLGRKLALSGAVETLRGGGVSFDALTVNGEFAQARVNGAATQEKADIAAQIILPDLHRADPRLTGRANVDAKLSGSLQKPDAALDVAVMDGGANGRPIPKLNLHADARDLLGALVASASLDGTVDGRALRGRVDAARAGTSWKVDAVDLNIGRASLKGSATYDGGATGRLTLAAPDLDDFSALALQKLGGALNADIAFDSASGGQNATIDAKGVGIRAQDASIERFSAKLSGRDLLRRPALEGTAALDNLRVGKELVSSASLKARPAGAGTALDVSVNARGFAVASAAMLTPGERTRVDLSALTVQRDGQRLALAEPATITLGGGQIDIKGVAINAGGGRLDVDGSVGDRLDITARARAVPLSIAAIADPALGLGGSLDAEAHIAGTKTAPNGDWKVTLAKVTAPQLRDNGLPSVDASAHGRLAGNRTSVDADIALGSASRVTIAGSAPINAAGGLDVAVKGGLDAALANTALSANGQTLQGKANIDLKITGPAAAPIVGGVVTFADGAFADPIDGLAFKNIAARLEAHGREMTLASMTATTGNGGQIAATGHISLLPEAGMPGSIHIGSRNAQLVNSDLVSSTADLDLTVAGPLARAPIVSGAVIFKTLEVNVPDRLPASLKPLPDAKHIDPKGFAREMLALQRKQKAAAGRPSTFDVALDVKVSAPNRIFVRGRGIDAEFGGELKISGTAQNPKIIGGFDLRRGRLQLLTQRIDITRGVLTFAGGLTPQLDFTAETTAADVTAQIAVSGPAAQPSFSFTSTPELPQDEVLSRLLFAKASGSLSPLQALQLATAVAQLSGADTGGGGFEKMRKALGVDSLDLAAGGAGGPTVGASTYLTDNINVGVRAGAKPADAAVNVGLDVTKRLRVQSETRMDGHTSVGVGVEWEY